MESRRAAPRRARPLANRAAWDHRPPRLDGAGAAGNAAAPGRLQARNLHLDVFRAALRARRHHASDWPRPAVTARFWRRHETVSPRPFARANRVACAVHGEDLSVVDVATQREVV